MHQLMIIKNRAEELANNNHVKENQMAQVLSKVTHNQRKVDHIKNQLPNCKLAITQK